MIWKMMCWMMLFPILIYADLNNELNKFFNQFGVSSHVDSAEIYNGQKAGYMTGGGFVTRNRVVNTQVASVNLPRFDAGCGGIDIFAGGFSFINHEQLIQTMKNIAGDAVGGAKHQGVVLPEHLFQINRSLLVRFVGSSH